MIKQLLFYGLLTLAFAIQAQSPNKIKKECESYFDQKKYVQALQTYKKLEGKKRYNLPLKYKIGLCHYHTNNPQKAISYLEDYKKNSSRPQAKVYYYLARIYHLSERFGKAATYYKIYLKLDTKSLEREKVKQQLLQCTHGAKLVQNKAKAIVANMGSPINSPANDYRACSNPRKPYQLFFSSDRNDSLSVYAGSTPNIYQASLTNGIWEKVQALSKRYNSPRGEQLVNFFDGGYQLVFLKEMTNHSFEIVVDNYTKDSLSALLPFALNASSTAWDGDHFFPSDSLVIFSSNRAGGYGGKDLYYSQLSKNGIWTRAVNLGADINSKYEEISPFLAEDGRSLYFSSDRSESLGGFDIYKTIYTLEKKRWNSPQNLGTPINSTGDDQDFWIKKNAVKAYFSSNRLGGLGGFDLYTAYFRTPQKEQLNSNSHFHFITKKEKINNQNSSSKQSTTASPLTKDATKYTISPVYYDAKTGEMESSNTVRLLANLLQKYPTLFLQLSAHSDNTGNPQYDIYLTIKQAELLAEGLLKSGVKKEQIRLRGCGQNYPIANNENFDGSPNLLAQKMNRRINIRVCDTANLGLNIVTVVPQVSRLMQSPANSRYQKKIKGLTYKVRLVSTPSLLTHRILKANFKHIITEKKADKNGIDYLIGLESTFTDISAILSETQNDYKFDKAQIIAYVDGLAIDDSEIDLLSVKYPDLKRYAAYLKTVKE